MPRLHWRSSAGISTCGLSPRWPSCPLPRCWTRAPGISTRGKIDYIWDNDQLIGEYQHGEYTWYINLPNQFHPVALIKKGEVFYYHLDQLNTPRFVTNNKVEVVWENQADVYGYEELEADADFNKESSFTQPIRFQGQYLDEESGLHYNRYRYYSPKQQRFINQDPIGLVGGINHYQYAPNPVNWVDPMGLLCKEGLRKLEAELRDPRSGANLTDDQVTAIIEVFTFNNDLESLKTKSSVREALAIAIESVVSNRVNEIASASNILISEESLDGSDTGVLSESGQKLDAIVKEDALHRINQAEDKNDDSISRNDLNKGLIASSRAGIKNTDYVSPSFENLGGKAQFKPSNMADTPGIEISEIMVNGHIETGFKITDTDAYIEYISETYDNAGQKLNDKTVELIKGHINHNKEQPYSPMTGYPGLHAEVQAVNDVFNHLQANNVKLDEKALSNVQVATYKLQKDGKKATPVTQVQGKEFVACKNCKGILRNPINIITKRAN